MSAPSGPVKPHTKGPVEIAIEVVMGTFYVAMLAWFVGIAIEIVGGYTFWSEFPAIEHSKVMVAEDLEHIAAAPKSLLVPDTVGFAQSVVDGVAYPFQRLGIITWMEQHPEVVASPMPNLAALTSNEPLPSVTSKSALANFKRTLHSMAGMFGAWAVIAMYVAQDVLLRLSVAAFALPAFLLACMVGVVDGLVRRDLRRWGGGRESSFVYHHAKRYTIWSLTGGLGLYLAWPFGGFNPAYMVLVFTLLVAITMSTTVGAFKKYM
jgi:integrating conjugative element membrane protein (TIGR03747 family)